MKAATCTEASKCSRCTYTEGSATGHNWDPTTGICKNDASHICDHTQSTSTETCSICGKSLHTHSWKYENDGANKVKATCEGEGTCPQNKDGGYAEITATDATYTGSPITSGAKVTYTNWVGSQDATVTYENNTNAGTATAKATVEGVTISTTFQITAASIKNATVTVNPSSGTYNGNAFDKPAVSVTLDGFGTLNENTDYTLSWGDNTEIKEPGTYTVTVTGNGNFTGEETATFKVNKITPTAADFDFTKPENLIYNTLGKTAKVAAKDGINGMGAVTIKYNGSTTVPTAAGTYKVTIDVAEGDYYAAATGIDGGWTFTINPTDGSISIDAGQTVTYDGTAVTQSDFTASITTDGTTSVKWYDSEGKEISAPTNVGTYQIGISAAASTNYKAVEEVKQTFTITQKELTITANAQEITYGDSIETGTAQVTIGALAEGDTFEGITLTPSTANVPGGTITPSVAVIKDGEEDVTANYKIDYVDGKLTINPASMTVTANGYEGIYDGNAHGITVNAPEGAKVEYSTNGTDWSETNPQFTNVADSTTVSYRVTKTNYETVTGSKTVTIKPIEVTVTVKEIADQPYTGSAITPAVTITPESGKLVGSDTLVEGTDYTVEYSTNNTNVGTVTVTIKDVTGGNYTVSGSGSFEIVQATNSWTTKPSIEKWTYGNTASTPNMGKAKFGTATVTYSGTANDGITVYTNSTTAPDKAGTYTATFTVAGTANYSGLTEYVTFTIGRADYNMSSAKWDYTSAFQYDGLAHTVTVTGLPSGVTVKEYSGNTATVKGTYTAKVTFTYDNANYNEPKLDDLVWEIANTWLPVEDTEYTTNDSEWKNTDFVITAKEGYKLSTTNTAEGTWADSLTGSTEGENGITFYVKNTTTGAISLAVTESYKLDKTAPTGTVSIDNNSWNDLWNTITFGLFYKETKTVKVVPADTLSGIAKVEYHESATALSVDQVKAITAWTDMGTDYAQDVTAEDAKTFIYYIRITDNAGNVTYISTADGTFDLTYPAISGITDGSTYYTTQKVTVTDTNLETVTLNGEAATGEITLEGNKEATYTIVATDKAGNETTYTVTMKPIASISAPIDGITENNVNSGNTDVIAEVEAAAAAVDTTNATEEEIAAIKAITDKCDALQEVVADTAAEYERITDAISAYDPDEVTSADKADLEKLAEDLKALVESGNLTDSEKTALETPTENLDAMIETVAEVTEESDRIADAVGDYALETVKSSDKDEIEQLIKDIDALLATDNLTDEERTALEGEKTKCENLLAQIEGTDALVDKLTEDVGAYDEDTVKSTDKAALEQLLEDIEAVIEGNTNITEEEKAELEALVDTVEDLLAKIEEVADAPVTEDTEKVKDTTSENVKIEDKEDLEKAKEDLEDALTENAGNYTEDEKKAIQEEIDRIDDALEAIENVESVEDTISELPDSGTVKPDDEDAIKAITDAKAEYDALTDHEKSLVSEDTKKKLDDLCAALVAYKITDGADGKYTQGGSKGLSFTANGAYSKFTGILVDNKVVDPKHYTAKSGSTVVTLKASYLDTLSTGKHTLTVVYSDGEASCEFKILAKSDVPATGDNSHMMLWFSLMIVSCAAILVLLNYKRFFSYGGKYSK